MSLNNPRNAADFNPAFFRASFLSLALVTACDGDDSAGRDDEIETTGGDVSTGLDPSGQSAGGVDTASTTGHSSSDVTGNETTGSTGGFTDGSTGADSTTDSADTGLGGGMHGPCPAGFDNIGSDSEPKCKVNPDVYSQVNSFPVPTILGSQAFKVYQSEGPFFLEGTTDMGTEILMVSISDNKSEIFVPIQAPVFDCENPKWDGLWKGNSPLFLLPIYDGSPYDVCFVAGNTQASSEKVCVEATGDPN